MPTNKNANVASTKTAESTKPAVKQRTVEVYDFRRPTTLAREHSRVLELAFETFARQWGTQMTAKVRVRSQITFDSVTIHTYDEYASNLPPATAMVLLNIADSAARAVIQFPTPAVLTWFNFMLGGTVHQAEPERQFTQIEQTMLRKLVDDTMDDLSYSMGPLLPSIVTINSVHHNSQFAQAAAPSELMIVANFTVHVGDSVGLATLSLPAEVVLRQLGETNPVSSSADASELIKAQLADVLVSLSLQVTAAPISPQSIIDLSVGDIVSLPHHSQKPLIVAVEGRPFARAALGANGPRLACVIVETQENR
jgi:flagellar motor switch protein FliM